MALGFRGLDVFRASLRGWRGRCCLGSKSAGFGIDALTLMTAMELVQVALLVSQVQLMLVLVLLVNYLSFPNIGFEPTGGFKSVSQRTPQAYENKDHKRVLSLL